MPLTNIRGLFWRGTPLVSRHYSMLKRFRNVRQHRYQVIHTARNFTTIGSIIRVIGRVAKLRYIITGSIAAGGASAMSTYDSWRQSLPDMSWLRNRLPSEELLAVWSQRLKDFGLPTISQDHIKIRMDKLRALLDKVEAYTEKLRTENREDKPNIISTGVSNLKSMMAGNGDQSGDKDAEYLKKIEFLQNELINIQNKLTNEIYRLEKENKDLRRQSMLNKMKRISSRRIKPSLIEMYSEVLDELSGFNDSTNIQESLPRVIVVGDQSSGKTSVLEMIAKARIFPRGSGEMMTRAPVKVTLSEGPYHIAQFNDDTHEYDLTKESELVQLRSAIEKRMLRSVRSGDTISSETISMTVKGPGIQRMILIDLPGIISTVTMDMASNTKEKIIQVCKQHIENPNAIILCIQDGSLDPERSNVTELVNSVDPTGKRTIFVLTKVDLAEKQLYDPVRIQKILEGKLFPMKALGYFAVVTGKDGASNNSISEIKQYEQDFFSNSKLFRDGALKATQMNTNNLSMAVSECFWQMVKNSVEQQAVDFRAMQYNIEVEWKNSFPFARKFDYYELFEKLRSDILDEVVNLSHISAEQWEQSFERNLSDAFMDYVFEDIYIPASQATNVGAYNTAIDIKLRKWNEVVLQQKSVDVAYETMTEQFASLLNGAKTKDKIADKLYESVRSEMKQHKWEVKAKDVLKVIQENVLEDGNVKNKQQWDEAIDYMIKCLTKQKEKLNQEISRMTSLDSKDYYYWYFMRYEKKVDTPKSLIYDELKKMFVDRKHIVATLTNEEMITVKKNLELKNLYVDNKMVQDIYKPLYRIMFIDKSLLKAAFCRKGFYHFTQGFKEKEVSCHDVILFWKVNRMLNATSNSLRQQVITTETRRLERTVKDILDDIGDDEFKLKTLLDSKQVTLAVKLKKVCEIQRRLEEFIKTLKEK